MKLTTSKVPLSPHGVFKFDTATKTQECTGQTEHHVSVLKGKHFLEGKDLSIHDSTNLSLLKTTTSPERTLVGLFAFQQGPNLVSLYYKQHRFKKQNKQKLCLCYKKCDHQMKMTFFLSKYGD